MTQAVPRRPLVAAVTIRCGAAAPAKTYRAAHVGDRFELPLTREAGTRQVLLASGTGGQRMGLFQRAPSP
jgi:hypothetical protein